MTTRSARVDGLLRSSAVACIVLAVSGLSASAASVPSSATRPPPAKPVDAPAQQPAEADASPRNAVARTRMLECGHQWNSQKKNGTASGTWKDFSRGCLAQR